MQVNVPSIGLVNFPDSMSQEEVSSTIKTKLLGGQNSGMVPMGGSIRPVTSMSDKLSLAFPDITRNLQAGNEALFSSQNPTFGTPNQNPGSVPQALKSVAQSAGNAIATPGGLALGALGLEGVNPMLWKALGLAFAPAAGKMIGQGLGTAMGTQVSAPQRILGAGEALQGGAMALGAVAPHLAGLPGEGQMKGPMLSPDQQRVLVNQQGAKEYAQAQALRSASPTKVVTPQVTQQQTAPETVPSTSKEPSTTSSLGMLDQQFRHDVGNAMQVINLHEQTKGLDQVQAAAARGLVKTLALRANAGEDVTAALQAARQRITDVAEFNKIQNKIKSLVQNNYEDLAILPLFQRNEQIKNKYQGKSPTIEGGQNVSSKAKINGQQKQDQGITSQAPLQAAPEKQVPGDVRQATGGNVVGNEQVNGGEGLASSVDKVDKTAGQEAKYPLSTSVHEGKMVDAEGRTVDPKTHKTTGESGFTIAPKEMWDSLFKNKGTKVDPIQMWNTLKNKLGETSGVFKTLQSSGLQGFLSAGPKSVQEVENWANENGPKVEVRKFGKHNAGSIFPESPLGKVLKEQGAKEVPNEMVQSALAKLDSIKAKGKDIYDAITSTHAWKSWWLKRQGYDLPKIESISPKFADAVSSYANSQVASVLRANANIAKVLGDKAENEQFRKQLGGIIYEDMRRAEGDVGNSVLSLKNSPFSSEAQYQAALKNPEMQQALARWKELIQAPATEMHQKLGGQMADSGKQTGAFANLIAVMQDEAKEPVANAPTTVGPMSTMKKGSAFSKERKFTGQEYNLDAKDMAFRMMTKNAQQAALRDMYQVGEQEGLLKLLKQGDETPANMIRQKNPVTLRTVVKDGETFHNSAYPAFDKRVASTLDQALQLNKSMADTLDVPAIHAASQIIIKTQVALGIDLGFHTFNDVVATANSPKGLLALPQKALSVAKAYQDQVAKTPELQEELARMAEAGVTFRGDSLGGWSSHALKVADTVTRLVLNREYEQLVAEKKVVDSAAERRRYINGRAGQYNKRFMTWFQQGMQETGIGAFNVAGRNFNRLAVGSLTFSPGVKATSKMEALRLRLSIATGIATAALILPAVVNTATVGDARPEGTEFGDIVVGKKKDGTYEVLNMRKWTMLARGGRASGLGAVMNEQVMPRLRGEQPAGIKQTVTDAAKDIGRTALAPFSGPPINLASTLLTGKTELGFGYEQRTPGEKAPYVKAAIGTLNPLVGPIVNQAGGQTPTERIEQRIGSVVGLQSSQSPFSVMRNRAVQFKARNKIGSDDTQSYGPGEYLPLKNALLQGDVETAKEQYQQLLHEKSQNATLSDEQAKKDAMMMIQKEFVRMENFRFVNKESEEAFKASLTPQQRVTYKTAVEQQKQMADLFFNQIQGKISNEDNGFHFHAPKMSGFKKFK